MPEHDDDESDYEIPAGARPRITPDEPPAPEPDAPELEKILMMSLGVEAAHDEAIGTMAVIHGRWRQAWTDTGKFTDDEAFELVRIIVAASMGGLRALS